MLWTAALPAFLASLVEFVEALTIVLAIGLTVSWRSSLQGALAAALTLAVLVALFGASLVLWVPLEVLRLVVGTILILFGLQWLKKALLRYGGLKALRDEGAIFAREVNQARREGAAPEDAARRLGFLTSFKSVLLEGLEVAFIVITFGATAGPDKGAGLGAASVGAGAALVLVILLGLIFRGPLVKVPENALKFTVGVLLVVFGLFWAGEGLGTAWPGGDLFLLALLGGGLLLSAVLVVWLRRSRAPRAAATAPPRSRPPWPLRVAREVFDFFCGDAIVFGALVLVFVGVGLGAGPGSGVLLIAGTAAGLVLSLVQETRSR